MITKLVQDLLVRPRRYLFHQLEGLWVGFGILEHSRGDGRLLSAACLHPFDVLFEQLKWISQPQRLVNLVFLLLLYLFDQFLLILHPIILFVVLCVFFAYRGCLTCPVPGGRPLLIKLGVPIDHPLDKARNLFEFQDAWIQKSLVLWIAEKLARDHLCIELVGPLHRALVLVNSIRIVALLALYPCILREEVLVKLDLVNKELFVEISNVVDQDRGLVGASPGTQRLVEALVVLQVELDAQLGWPVLHAHLHGHYDLGVVQCIKVF